MQKDFKGIAQFCYSKMNLNKKFKQILRSLY